MFGRVFSRFSRTVLRRAPHFSAFWTRPRSFRAVAASATAASSWCFFQLAEAETKTPIYGIPGTDKERTFIAIKPDGVQRGLMGEIVGRFERKGYKLVAMKLVTVTPEFAAEHYDDLKSKPFFKGLTQFFSSGPILAMVWEGPGVIKGGRRLLGETKPEDSLPGTIRGDLCVTIGRNICHGSDSPEGAQHEIPHWFKESEISNWTPENEKWVLEKK